MAFTYEDIQRVVSPLKTMKIKGKEYVTVPERVKAFRELCPQGCISTEIVRLDAEVVVMRATVADDQGNILATGLAFERQDSSYINKTSYIENCETSAVGRALGWVALGVDSSMASAEEMVNALKQQEKIMAAEDLPPEDAPPFMQTVNRTPFVRGLCDRLGISSQQFGAFKRAAVENGIAPDKRVNEMTEAEFSALVQFVEKNA